MNLEKLGLSSGDLLQRSQLATITGGNAGGTCGYATRDSNGQWYGDCNVSQSEAVFMIQGYDPGDAYYCCDSCGTTFYCGDSISPE